MFHSSLIAGRTGAWSRRRPGSWVRTVAVCGLLGLGFTAAAQARRAPIREADKVTRGQEAPVRESKTAPLPPKKLEEALRLLLQADSAQTQRQQAQGLEFQGFVVDQTITKIGRDFYSVFYTSFEPPPGLGEYTIAIAELPARGNSALITLSVNDELLLEMPLQPKYDLIEEAAIQAVSTATEFLLNAQRVSNQLERGELKGTDVY